MTTTTAGADTQQASVLDIHVLLASPYANLNRDDTGSPKTASIGGAERARVSSQCQKRAVRKAMSLAAAERTRRLPEKIADALTASGDAWTSAAAAVAASGLLAALGLNPYKGNISETDILTFLPDAAAGNIAAALNDCAEDMRSALSSLPDDVPPPVAAAALAAALSGKTPDAKNKPLKAAYDRVNARIDASASDMGALLAAARGEIGSTNPVISLFGRMLTAMPDTNVDGAAQVAHAFSTHAADIDTDYFTAVDDLNPATEPGAGMIGTPDYVSATYYRRAVVGLTELRDRLDSDPQHPSAATTAAAFAAAFATSISDAKSASCGPPPRPSLVLVVARSDTPVSYANAFERPVPADPGGGFLIPSARRLLREASADRDDPGIVAAWLYMAPSVASETHDDIRTLFAHTPVTLHNMEQAIRDADSL